MSQPPPRKPLIVALSVLGLLAGGLATLEGQGQTVGTRTQAKGAAPRTAAPAQKKAGPAQKKAVAPEQPRPAAPPVPPPPVQVAPIMGPAASLSGYCRTCHNQGPAGPFTPQQLQLMICRMTEWGTYDADDKHKLAFQGLIGERGRRMASALGYQSATEIKACLACHVTLPAGFDANQLKDAQVAAQMSSEGVSCVSCHGANPSWIALHQLPFLAGALGNTPAGQINWTQLSRKDKEAQYGMTDLWDPASRAATCASCHIGNHAEGKVVTHAMYAAGHPPLPSFEPATFSDAEPRHWQYLREKTPAQQARLQPYDADNREQAQLVALGGLVSLREQLELFLDQARADAPEPVGAKWPDFARFDCAACHHDLKAVPGGAWRQHRSFEGAPGRPSFPAWPAPLSRIGLLAAGTETAAPWLESQASALSTFESAVAAKPYSDRDQAISSAEAALAALNPMIDELRTKPVDAARAAALLEQLAGLARSELLDYDSARQIAWAYRAILTEINPEKAAQPAVSAELDALDRELALTLPSARQQVAIEKSLGERLRLAADYDPYAFRERMARLDALVKAN